jgi:hypothetical protein
MKYNVIKAGESEFDVVTQDGGVASIRFMYEDTREATTDYYQSRITNEKTWEEVWTNLGLDKMYYNDWTKSQSDMDVLINEALNWLVVGETNWELDETLFNHIK